MFINCSLQQQQRVMFINCSLQQQQRVMFINCSLQQQQRECCRSSQHAAGRGAAPASQPAEIIIRNEYK